MSIDLKKIVFHENKGMGDFIAKIEVPFYVGTPDFILLLDNTNNMINHFDDIVNKVIPSVFEKLKYKNQNVILITFTNQEIISIQQMKSKIIHECPHFKMAEAIESLKKVFENYKGAHRQIRILTLSAGEIDDQITTKYKIDSLVKSFSKQFLINSQGIRLMVTEEANPETRALCSMLRLTNITAINTELLELTPFREEDYIKKIIESSEYQKIETNCNEEKYNLTKSLKNECEKETNSFLQQIEDENKKWENSKEYVEYNEKKVEIYYKKHRIRCCDWVDIDIKYDYDDKFHKKKKDCLHCKQHINKMHFWHNYQDLCNNCQIKKNGWKYYKELPQLCEKCKNKKLSSNKSVEECEKCKCLDLSVFGHKIIFELYSLKYKPKHDRKFPNFDLKKSISYLEKNSSKRPLKSLENKINSSIQRLLILYEDIFDELLQLQLLKINRDKKINNIRFGGIGKKYFELLREIRITNEIIILNKEDENEDPEKEKFRNEINRISQIYQVRINQIKNESDKLDLIDKYINDIKKKLFGKFNLKENQAKIKEINEKYYEESDKIIYKILYKNFENSSDDFQIYRKYKDIVFKRSYKNNLDENEFIENLPENKQKLFDEQNYYQYVINCEKEEVKIDQKWNEKINYMKSEFELMVNNLHLEFLKKCDNNEYCNISTQTNFQSQIKFKNIEKAILDLSLAYYYYCQSIGENKIINQIKKYKKIIEQQKKFYEEQKKKEYKTKEENDANSKMSTEMLALTNEEFLDWNENDSWEASEEDIKNFSKIYLELYLNQIKESNNKILGHEIIKKMDKFSISQKIKQFEKKVDKKVEEKYEFKNPKRNQLYTFSSSDKSHKYCHIIWNKDLCKNIFFELLKNYIKYDYNHLLYTHDDHSDEVDDGRRLGETSEKIQDEIYDQLNKELKDLWNKLYYVKYGKTIDELRGKINGIIDKYNNKKSSEFDKIDKKYENKKSELINKKIEEMRKEVNDKLSDMICILFEKDGLNEDDPYVLESGENILMNNPNDKPSNKIILNSGSNTIFCKNKPESISVFNNNDNKIDLNIEQGEDINAYNYIEIIGKDKITYIIQKTSINKIADTQDSRSESTEYSDYFSNFDKTLDGLENTLDADGTTISSILGNINSTNSEQIENKKVNDFIKDKIKLTESKVMVDSKPLSNTSELYFVLIMDTSDEMKNDIKGIQEIIYKFLNKLGYKDDQEMTILTFNNKSIDIDIEDLPTTKIKTKGGREISEIFNKLRSIVKENSNKKFQILFFVSGKIEDEDDSQIEAYKFKNEINNKLIVQTNVMQYKSKEKKKEQNCYLYSEATHALLRNISTVAIDFDAKFTTINYNDSEETKIKKLMNMFCSYKNRADLKLVKEKKNDSKVSLRSINICDLEYKDGNVQDKKEEMEKIEKIRETLIKAFSDIKLK